MDEKNKKELLKKGFVIKKQEDHLENDSSYI